MINKLTLILCALVLMPVSVMPAEFAIPSDRTITWTGNVGVDGGIPARTTIYQSLGTAGQASTYAQSVTYSQINTALNNCPTGQTVYLNAGTYTITGTITIPSNKTLRGAGMNNVILKSTSSLSPVVRMGGSYTEAAGVNVTSGYTKGSTSIVVASASGISAGDFIRIDELNDSSIPVTQVGVGGTCTWCSRGNGDRARQQVVEVTNVSSNTITFKPALFFTFSAGNDPEIQPLSSTITQFAGLEDLTVLNDPSGGASARTGLELMGTANCWAKGVKFHYIGERGFWARIDNLRSEVRNCYFTDALNHVDSDNYSLELVLSSSCLVENNAFYDVPNAVMTVAATGSVISYNYLEKVFRNTFTSSTCGSGDYFWPDSWEHGAHSSMNLYEGNNMASLCFDTWWGNNSYNVVFRNRFRGKMDTITHNAGCGQIQALLLGANNNYCTIIGNVLGTSEFHTKYEETAPSDMWTTRPIYSDGLYDDSAPFTTMLRHRNYDYYTNTVKNCAGTGEPSCQGGTGTDTDLANSLYLTGKPSWFGSLTWPPYDPVGPVVGTIPAQYFYTNGSWPEESSTPPSQGCTISGGGTKSISTGSGKMSLTVN